MAATALTVAFAFTGAAAAAATAPSATTGAVTSIGSTTVTITGSVNPNGTATSWYFEYGTTTSYGTKTAEMNDGSGTSDSAVSASLTGLTPGTTYHYQLVATSTAGTTNGGDGIFTTTNAPAPVVVTSAASAITSTGATLNGTVNPNGQSTTWYFEYGTTTSYGTKTPVQSGGSGSSAVSVSAAISGLVAGQVYHFRVDATSSAGTTVGSDMTFTTTPIITVGAPIVTTAAATSVTASGAKLNGTVNPNGQATTWYFEYGPTTAYGSKTPVENAGSGTKAASVSITVTNLAQGVYHFHLVAANASGTIAGNDLTFGGGAPVVLTGSAQGTATTSVTLTGSVNPEGKATKWYFEYGKTTNYGTKTSATSVGSGSNPTGVSVAITNLTSGTTYHYRLVAANAGGTTTGGDVTFTTALAVTMNASTVQSVYGKAAMLSGTVSNNQAGVTVSVLAEPFGSTSFSTVGTAQTGTGGVWSLAVHPRIATAYEAGTPDGTSPPITIGVRPAVSLRVITGHRLTTRVVALRSFMGKIVQFQRAVPGNKWVTVARAKLSAKSSAVFSAKHLPAGTSTIRIAMSVNQGGAGYLGAFSRTLSYTKK
jgi:hypothetical protein